MASGQKSTFQNISKTDVNQTDQLSVQFEAVLFE